MESGSLERRSGYARDGECRQRLTELEQQCSIHSAVLNRRETYKELFTRSAAVRSVASERVESVCLEHNRQLRRQSVAGIVGVPVQES